MVYLRASTSLSLLRDMKPPDPRIFGESYFLPVSLDLSVRRQSGYRKILSSIY